MNCTSSIQFNQFLYSISNTGAGNDFAHSNEEHDISPIEDAAARGKFFFILTLKIPHIFIESMLNCVSFFVYRN